MSKSRDPHDDQPHGGSYVDRDVDAERSAEEALKHPASDRPGEYVRRDEDDDDVVVPEAGGRYVDRDQQGTPTDTQRGRYVRREDAADIEGDDTGR